MNWITAKESIWIHVQQLRTQLSLLAAPLPLLRQEQYQMRRLDQQMSSIQVAIYWNASPDPAVDIS